MRFVSIISTSCCLVYLCAGIPTNQYPNFKSWPLLNDGFAKWQDKSKHDSALHIQERAVTTTVPLIATPTPTKPPKERKSIDPLLSGCTSAQQKIIKQAWTEAESLAKAHAKWLIPERFGIGKFQPAMSIYMGEESKNYGGLWASFGPLKENIQRQQSIHMGLPMDAPPNTFGYIYCAEDKMPTNNKPKKSLCSRNTTAWTFDERESKRTTHYVVLCPTFFDNARMASLAQRVEEARNKPDLQTSMEPWRSVRARVLFHETYYWGETVSKPKCDLRPQRHRAQDVVRLAKEQNIATVKLNAESWTLAAMAIYLQETFNLAQPPEARGKVNDDFEEISVEKPDWFASPTPQAKDGLLLFVDAVALSGVD